MYKCRICSKEFSEIPKDAVEITAKRRGTLYQFAGGEVHDLYRTRSVSADHRWHRNPRWDCIFCYPLAKPEQPVEQPVLVQAPVQLPEIIVEEVKVVAEIEDESELTELSAITSLAAAFNRIRK